MSKLSDFMGYSPKKFNIWRTTDQNGFPLQQQPAYKYDPSYAIATPVRLWSGALFQALDPASGTDVYSSPDGKVWTLRALPFSQLWRGIASDGAGKFCAVGGTNTTQAAISSNGTSWSGSTLNSPADWGEVASLRANEFVAVTNGASGASQYTTNGGTTWNTGAVGVTVNRIQAVGNRYIAGGQRYSTDGINWSAITGAGAGFRFAFGNTLYGGNVATSTNLAIRSTDGITFTNVILPVTDTWAPMGFDSVSGLFVLTASSGTGVVLTSPDLLTWTQRKNYDLTSGASQSIAGPSGLMVQQGGVLRLPDRNAVEVTYLI